MRLFRRRFALVLPLLLALVAACVDAPTSTPPRATMHSGTWAAITPGSCTTIAEIERLARLVFTAKGPNVNSVLGKIRNLEILVKQKKYAQAEERAHEIVAFTLKKNAQRALGGTEEQIAAFINAVYCYAGIVVDVDEPSNTHLILPSDEPQVVTNIEGTVGIQLPANPVAEPTLVEFVALPGGYPPGAGPLDTKLDQYPGFVMITKTSETNAPLAKPVVVGVCAEGVIPASVRARLRLGHGKASGFEIAPAANADFIQCPNPTAAAQPRGILGTVAALVLPKPLLARQDVTFGGGVGGTVTEFSPFAPVDPELSFGGGVGGTVTEFLHDGASLLSETPAVATETCDALVSGKPVPEACRPFVRVRTRMGTVLSGVPVDWTVIAGGGTVAPRGESCGTYGSAAGTATDANGLARICWRLGAAGENAVRASASPGGDAPAGVSFTPVDTVFTIVAKAGPPTKIMKIAGDGQTVSTGSFAPVAPKVLVTDDYGNPLAGVPVHWLIISGDGRVTPSKSYTDATGHTSAAWKMGPRKGTNTLKAYIDVHAFVYVYFNARAK